MKNLLTFPRSAAAVAGSLLAILTVVGTAQAANDTVYKYSTPKTGYFTIDHTTMVPTASGVNYAGSFADSLRLTAASGTCFGAGVHLPHGAKITAVSVAYRSGNGEDPTAYVISRRFSNGAIALIALTEIVDNSDTRKIAHLATDPAVATVNNAVFSYTFAFCLSTTDNYFDIARITYTYQNAGD
jgi:hypothetical protein